MQAFRDTMSGPHLDILDMPLDVPLFRTLELSLGAVIVVYGKRGSGGSAGDAMIDHAINCLEFFEKESCGKCVPCRLGCQQLAHFAEELRHNRTPLRLVQTDTIVRLVAGVMETNSICGLGRAASNPFLTWLDYFSK